MRYATPVSRSLPMEKKYEGRLVPYGRRFRATAERAHQSGSFHLSGMKLQKNLPIKAGTKVSFYRLGIFRCESLVNLTAERIEPATWAHKARYSIQNMTRGWLNREHRARGSIDHGWKYKPSLVYSFVDLRSYQVLHVLYVWAPFQSDGLFLDVIRYVLCVTKNITYKNIDGSRAKLSNIHAQNNYHVETELRRSYIHLHA